MIASDSLTLPDFLTLVVGQRAANPLILLTLAMALHVRTFVRIRSFPCDA